MLAQLCMFNAKQKQNIQNNNQRKNIARESPIPIYFHLCINIEISDKKIKWERFKIVTNGKM